MPVFSLWEKPWLPVMSLTGEAATVSLRDALAQAHELREVFDPSPLVTVAAHRLLLAVLYRVYRPESESDWATIWRTGMFDRGPLDSYGAANNQHFDLLDAKRPFYQVPVLPDEKAHPISALVMEAASGNNPTLFDHGRAEGGRSLPFDRAACHLIAYQAFALGGGVSKPFNRMDAPLTKGLVVEALGRTLFETLMFNLVPLDRWSELVPSSPDDAPFWEMVDPPKPLREGTVPLGPMHYLTWQSRQVHLMRDEESDTIITCQIRQRYTLPKDGSRLDPNKAYRRSKKEGWQPFRLNRERAVWQYTHVLLQAGSDLARPYLSEWLAQIQSRQFQSRFQIQLPTAVQLQVSGLTTDPKKAAKVDLWRRERLPLPLTLLEQPELAANLEEMLGEARRAESLLLRTAQALVWSVSERQNMADAVTYVWTGKVAAGRKLETLKGLANSLGMVTSFWPILEGPFRIALEDLPRLAISQVRDDWRQAVMHSARRAFDTGCTTIMQADCPFEVISRISSAFHGKLTQLFRESGEEEGQDDEGADE